MERNVSLDDFLPDPEDQDERTQDEPGHTGEESEHAAAEESEQPDGTRDEQPDGTRDEQPDGTHNEQSNSEPEGRNLSDDGPYEATDGNHPTTGAWSPEPVSCPECGKMVHRRWRQDADLVCEHCKDWSS